MIESIAHVIARVLVIAFLIGMTGSAFVVLITVLDDIRDFFSEDEAPASVVTGLK